MGVSSERWTARAPDSGPQDARGRPNDARSGSWSLEAPEGRYAAIPAWLSRAAWIDACLDALSTPVGAELRRRAKVSADTLMRVAKFDAETADRLTGRGVATAHETVAAALGMSARHVGRARRLLEALGLAETVAEGRYLSTRERKLAHAAHGGHQLRAASLRALTMPRPVENVQLPRRSKDLLLASVFKNSPRRASAPTSAAPRPPASKRKKKKPSTHGTTQPRPLELQRFAARLMFEDREDPNSRSLWWVLRSPAGGRDRHIGALCDVLSSAGIDPRKWRPRQLIETIDRWSKDAGRKPLAWDADDPLRYLAWQLSQAINPADPTPAEQAAARSAQRAADAAERRRAAEAERERMANVDHEEVARIIAQMKAEAAAAAAKFETERRRFRRLPVALPERAQSARGDRQEPSTRDEDRT